MKKLSLCLLLTILFVGLGHGTALAQLGEPYITDRDGDGDIDNSDLLTILGTDPPTTVDEYLAFFGNFTGPGGGGESIPGTPQGSWPGGGTLNYISATGEVILTPEEPPEITIPEDPPWGGLVTGFVLLTDVAGPGFIVDNLNYGAFAGGDREISVVLIEEANPFSLGSIMPSGLDGPGVQTFLPGAYYTGPFGLDFLGNPYSSGVQEFGLYVDGHAADGGGGCLCVIGDANCDGYVDIAGDILPAFTNFTSPGTHGKTRAQGDVHGDATGATKCNDPHDGDVDVQDLLTMFGNFTGPAPDGSGGLAAAEAGDANIPDLIYNPVTGEVTLDVDGSGIIGYVPKNGSSDFNFGNHAQILAGVKTSVLNELSEAAFASSVGANSIGNVFPTGMNLAALTVYLTVNDVSRSLGAPVVPFDLVVLGPAVPEPSTFAMAVVGLAGLGLFAIRRRGA